MPWRRKRLPTPVFLPGGSHGQRSLAGYSSGGHKELEMTEWLIHTDKSFSLGKSYHCVSQVPTFYKFHKACVKHEAAQEDSSPAGEGAHSKLGHSEQERRFLGVSSLGPKKRP